MTLTDLANHICTQTGMTDTDDVSAAMMFLQRRLEMIWNGALWRDSLLEATLTVNPDDTTTLADSYWISERSVLLLPAAMEKVIAARINTNALQAASLESYYRADTDWLNYQGTPFEFQVLKPVVMEWATAQTVTVSDTNTNDNNITCNYSYSPNGVTICTGSGSLNATLGTGGSPTGILQVFSFSKAPTAGNVVLTAGAWTVTIMPTCNTPPIHQRIRLTEAPTVSTNLRVLGKAKCPILGPYDVAPITNVEPALMAFARGDLLLRQRQFGKANLAMQEGAALLKELVETEAFQQAGEFRIQPDAGFGENIWWYTQPDSYHPLG